MTRSGRTKWDQVFSPAQQEEYKDLIDNAPFGAQAGQSVQTNLHEVPNQTNVVELSTPPPAKPPTAPPAVAKSNVASLPPRQATSGTSAKPLAAGAKRVARSRRRSIRPPEASIAYSVYTRLLEVSADEKHQKGLAARPYGVIVMDALDRHAAVLEKHWSDAPAESVVTNSLFVRSDTALLRRRRTGSKKTVPLSGISAENRRLLDRYAQEWNAGGRSALVEEALRLEFGMPPSDDPAEHSGS